MYIVMHAFPPVRGGPMSGGIPSPHAKQGEIHRFTVRPASKGRASQRPLQQSALRSLTSTPDCVYAHTVDSTKVVGEHTSIGTPREQAMGHLGAELLQRRWALVSKLALPQLHRPAQRWRASHR